MAPDHFTLSIQFAEFHIFNSNIEWNLYVKSVSQSSTAFFEQLIFFDTKHKLLQFAVTKRLRFLFLSMGVSINEISFNNILRNHLKQWKEFINWKTIRFMDYPAISFRHIRIYFLFSSLLVNNFLHSFSRFAWTLPIISVILREF